MKHLSIRKIREDLPHLDKVLFEEGEVIITRHGKPIARVLPINSPRKMPSHANLRATMPSLDSASADYIREDRDAR